MLVVAVSGWKGSGKDLAATYLTANYGFLRYAFADIIKDLVSKQYNIPRDWCDSSKHKEQPLPQYPVITKDLFADTIHLTLAGEFRDRSEEHTSELQSH